MREPILFIFYFLAALFFSAALRLLTKFKKQSLHSKFYFLLILSLAISSALWSLYYTLPENHLLEIVGSFCDLFPPIIALISGYTIYKKNMVKLTSSERKENE